MIGLRDPAGFSDRVLLVAGPLLDLVSLLDGERDVAEICAVLAARHGGEALGEEPIEKIVRRAVEQLDAAGFLDSPGFAARRRAIEDGFRKAPTRPAAHAGGAYAGEPAALREQIGRFFESEPEPRPASAGRGLRGLIAPHIDFPRGGPTYGWAYRELAASDADLFVILGTCHAGMPDPFSVTLKAYETPLGPAPVDRDLVEAIQRRYRGDLLSSEPAHRTEHSIEFQVVMLRYVLGERRPFTILPVLASFLHEAVWHKRDPEADRRVPDFVDALLGSLAAGGRRACLIAGVDLAHVGPRFGDAEPNSDAFLAEVERADRSMLEAVTAGDPVAFYASVAADGDARRICGLSPIYTFLRALPGVPGRLVRYSQWPDPQAAVSFCAAAFP
jgi:hypothetical protein